MLKHVGRSSSTCDTVEALARIHYHGGWKGREFLEG